jgi:hypothetical protein
MALAQSEWIRIYSGATNYARWQSYYVGQTINSYTHLPFKTGGLIINQAGDQSSLNITLPATPEVVSIVDAAVDGGYLVRVELYQFDPDVAYSAPPSGQTLISAFTGEIIGGGEDRTTVTLELGSSLSPIGAQIPPLKYTTALVGEPCRL